MKNKNHKKSDFIKLSVIISLLVFSSFFAFTSDANAQSLGCYGDTNGDGNWDDFFGATGGGCYDCTNGGFIWCSVNGEYLCIDPSWGLDAALVCESAYYDPAECTAPGVPACLCSAAYSSCTSCNGPATDSCTGAGGGEGCGDGICAPGMGESYESCPLDCSEGYGGTGGPYCGNNVRETGEGCDEGSNNGSSPALCSATCQVNQRPICQITSFEADDYFPPYNTSTTLRFNLNFTLPWTITLVGVATTPTPIPDTGISYQGTSFTGNLTDYNNGYTYELNCNNGKAVAQRTIWPQAPVDNADFISQNVPSTSMTTGQTQTVTLTMTNDGDTTWTQADEYKLGGWKPGEPPDDSTWLASARVLLAPGDSIAPGDSKIFTFNITAPTTQGTYNFRWRMVKEGIGWFGEVSDNVPITVNPPASPTLSVSASASPASGVSPLSGTVTANVSGTATGAIDYKFYCFLPGNINPQYTFSSSNTVESRGCSFGTGTYTVKINTTREGVSADSNQVTVTVSPPGSPNKTVTAVSTVGGRVKSTDNVIDTSVCGSPCTKIYTENSTVILTAIPSSAYWRFNGWTGDCSGTGPCTVIVDNSKSVTAIFVPRAFNYQEF